jgi:hypothetical protein
MSVFAGVKFFLSNRLSMEDHRNLRKIIADQGGQIVEQPGDSKCFHVLPLFTQPDAEVRVRVCYTSSSPATPRSHEIDS